jgi:hypothetical protein
MESEPIALAKVATRGDFVSFISEFVETAVDYSGELAEFLRSVLRVALPHHEEQPPWRLSRSFFRMLSPRRRCHLIPHGSRTKIGQRLRWRPFAPGNLTPNE